MLKILQDRIQQWMNQELPDVQAGFRKGRGTSDQISNICWIIEKAEEPEIKLPTSTESLKRQENSRKMSISALLTMPKPLAVWIMTYCGKF